MSRSPVGYTHRLNERGDLVRVEVAPEGHVESSQDQPPQKSNSSTPPHPKFHSPPVAKINNPGSAPPKQSAIGSNGDKASPKNTNAVSSPTSPPPLRLYADKDIRALERNPMHNDIMSAAETFKGRRDANSAEKDVKSEQSEESDHDKKVTEYLKKSPTAQLPAYDPEEIRKKKQTTTVVNTEMRWNEPKPFGKRNTYRVVPNSKTSTLIASAQDSQEKLRHAENGETSTTGGPTYKRIEDVPSVETLLDLIPMLDEKGTLIPDWKRKLMAKNYREKLCSQLPK